jgi:putative ABC transport system permease protein
MPAVENATVSEFLPGRGGADVLVSVPGVAPPDGQTYFTATWSAVDSSYFATLRLPLVAGRAFNDADRAGTQPVVILCETAARQFWPGQDPIGQSIARHDLRPNGEDVVTALQVVGVVHDVIPPPGTAGTVTRLRSVSPGADRPPPVVVANPSTLMMYVPFQQRYTPRFTLLARSATRQRLGPEIRLVLRSVDASLPMSTPQPLDSQTGPVQLQLRIAASVAGGVGLVGLLLASIGVYGVTAYTTARRTREFGIRIAMGAQRADVILLVFRQGIGLVLAGSAIGLTLAAASGRLFTRLLFGMPPLDPVAFGGAALLFVVVGLAACYLPARRATQIDAMEALRYE